MGEASYLLRRFGWGYGHVASHGLAAREEEKKVKFWNVAQYLRAVIKDEKGLESLEYAVFAVAFLVIISGVVVALSGTLSTAYSDIGNWIATRAGAM